MQPVASRQFQPMSTVKIEVVRDSLHFSAAHFTIFSATKRENLHGHNFHVQAVFDAKLGDDGLVFDYGIVKKLLQDLCDDLDETFLVPTLSPYLKINQQSDSTTLLFHDDTMTLPNRDIKLFKVRNITVEEIANWFADKLLNNPTFNTLEVLEFQIKIASGSGQWGIVSRSVS